MSVPSSMRIGPLVPTILLKRRYITLYFFIVWFSFIPIFLELWVYWQFLWNYDRPIHFYTFLPLIVIPMYITLVFSATFIAKLLYWIVNAIHKPRTGVFLRHPSDKDFRYWCIRNVIKKWPFWLSHRFPFPFMNNFLYKMFGVKTRISNSLFEGWVDTEFIEFGRNVVVGQGAIVMSSMIVGNLLIVKKTRIDDEVRIGSHAIIMPGTHIKKRSVLAANSVTVVDQTLDEGYIYVGVPAKELKRNYFFENGLQDKLGQVEDVEALRERYEKMYLKRVDAKEKESFLERRKEKKRTKAQEQFTHGLELEEDDDDEAFDDTFTI
jgi:acetyltransferase-like isoleucine patch superfamily enzyme